MGSDGAFRDEQVARGWETIRQEYCYGVPKVDIEGEIPRELCGTFYRNGPGNSEVWGRKLQHPIDGDGLVCALQLEGGGASLTCKFVRTAHRTEEERERKMLYNGSMGTYTNGALTNTLKTVGAVLKGALPNPMLRNPSNTSIISWGGKLLTTFESRFPYLLDPITLETIGIETLNGELDPLNCLAAHFHIDPKRDRLVCFSLRPEVDETGPKLRILEFDPQWRAVQKQDHSIPGLNYSHDFVLTENYYAFHMTPFVRSGKWVGLAHLMGWRSLGEGMRYYNDLPSKFVVIPRMGSGRGIQEFRCPPFHIFHFGTAWEEGGDMKFNAVCLPTGFTMEHQGKTFLSNSGSAPGQLRTFSLPIGKGSPASEQEEGPSDPCSCEFPTSHPFRFGQKCRYTYLMAAEGRPSNHYRAVVRHDAEGGPRQVWQSEGVVGEPMFVPRGGALSADSQMREDDGWVIVQVYRPEGHRTEFSILDASDLGKGPLATIRLHHHLPYGFHGAFQHRVAGAGATSPTTAPTLSLLSKL